MSEPTIPSAAATVDNTVRNARTRRRIEIALGCLWLLDGALQFQPYMFSKEFFAGILGMANMGLPGPVAADDYRVAALLVVHPAIWNAVFASLQVLLGLGILWRRTSRAALAASIPWAIGVWVLGEGFGGMFMGGTSLITGAPGAALIYAVVAVLVWPGIPERASGRFGLGAWVVIWCGPALLELQTVNHLPGVPGAQIVNGGYNEPAWLASLDSFTGHLFTHRGTELAIGLGVAAALIGLGALWPATRRAALTGGIALGVVLAVVGQNFGSIATGQGTDPGTGPLLVLLGLALWPQRSPAAATAAATAEARPRRQKDVALPSPALVLQSRGSLPS